tara:strand:- start:33 stop:170 length:138 start_codon:yes stop_codon:yes gene_type:complete
VGELFVLVVGYSVAKKPTETPLTFTAYAAIAIGAKLSFAFSVFGE